MNKPKLIYSLTLVMTITIRHFVSTVADYGLDSKWKRHKPKFSGIVSLVPCKRRGGGGDHSIGSKMKLIFKWYIQGHWPLETWTSGYVGEDGIGWFFTLADADCLVAENGLRSNCWEERDKVNYTKYNKMLPLWSMVYKSDYFTGSGTSISNCANI